MTQILFVSGQGSASAVIKNLGTLTLLLFLLPFNLITVFLSAIWNITTGLFRKKTIPTTEQKRILITGGKMTKALQLARSFHRDGHEVFLVETHKYWLSGHRFSNAVKGFNTVPAPEKDSGGYCQGLLNIVKKNDIDLFVPVSSPVASYYDSLAKKVLEPYCESIHLDPEITQILDDKYAFCSKASELDLSAPKVFRITDSQQILDFDFESDGSKYILKSIPYDSVLRLDLTRLPFAGMESYVKSLPISAEKPWVMQEFIRGQEYCFHATVRNGKIRLHCCSKSSPFQINYEQVDNPEIYQWVEKFVREMNLTGQICFDMIQVEDGTVYPIECNPRLHSAITMFHDHPGVAQAYLVDGEAGDEAITPLPNSKPTYWTYHELWRLLDIRSLSELKAWWSKVTKGTDAILQPNDPLPF